jgi:hypothetical protein
MHAERDGVLFDLVITIIALSLWYLFSWYEGRRKGDRD